MLLARHFQRPSRLSYLWLRRFLVGTASASAMVGIAGSLTAAEWSLRPSLIGSAEYLDNLTLRARRNGEPDKVWRNTLEGGARFAYRTEITEISIRPTLRLTRFPGDSQFNSEDRALNLNATHRTERSLFSLLGRYALDTTLSSSDSADDVDDDTDLVRSVGERVRMRIAPSWRYALSERTDLDMRVDYRAELNDNDSSIDYSYTTLSGGVTHKLTERDELSLALQTARFEPRNSRDKVDTVSAVVELKHEFDPTLSASAHIGWADSNFRFSTATASGADDNNALFGLGLRKELPLTSLEADFARTLEPSSSTGLIRRDQLKLSAIRQITEHVTGGLNFRYFKRRPLTDDPAFNDREYARFDASVSYRVTREWSLDWRYRYSWQEDEGEGTAKGNAVLLQLRWQGRKQAISR